MELVPQRFDPYSSLQHLVDELAEKGYKERFSVESTEEMQDSKGNTYTSNDLVINETHRLVNKEHKSQTTAVYAIAAKSGVKGIIVDHYGKDADDTIMNFLMNVERHNAL